MFDQIRSILKDHLGNNEEVSSAIPAGQADAVHDEIAGHVTNGFAQHAISQGDIKNILSQLQAGLTSGNPITNAIEGGLVNSLGSKFGLSPMVMGAIVASLPTLLQKFAHKANDPNDPSITHESITKSISSMSAPAAGN